MTRHPRFELRDILLSNKFIKNIFEAAKITTATHRESSFNVYGDLKKFRIAKAIEEEFDSILIDQSNEIHILGEEEDESMGVIYTKKDHGFWKPVDSMRIMGIHFHPPDSIAVPSFPDIKGTYLETRRNMPIRGYGKYKEHIHSISIVGHVEGSIITLFIYQCTDKFKFTNMAYEIGILEGMDDELTGKYDKYQELDYSNKNQPDEVAEYISSRGFFKSRVIRFKNRDEYEKEIEKIVDDFSLTYFPRWKQLDLLRFLNLI